MDADLTQRLGRRALELVDIPSVSGDEAALAQAVDDALPAAVERVHVGSDVQLYAVRRGRPLIVLAGHLDTVPAQANLPGRLEDGAVAGLGASDMKGGLAVMIELARWAVDAETLGLDLGFLFFVREELAPEESPVPDFLAVSADVRAADLVVVLEPTDNTIQAGCLGNLNASIVFHGESAHSARPWLGVNAIDCAVAGLAPLTSFEPLPVEVEGLTFVEVLSLTGIAGGIAQNVVPDRVEALLNYRYAPSRSPEEAEERLRELAGAAGELAMLSNSPPAPVVSDRPLVRRLREAGGFEVEPKQAWTPVAQFAAAGLDAVNLGPGATRYAHRRDERVEVAELVRTYEALRRFASFRP